VKTRYLRYGLMTVILGLTVYLAFGYGSRSFEAFCPFGGMESLWGLIVGGQFSCALGPLNLSLLIGLLILALVAKKVFCGWACPIGFLSELMHRISGKVWPKRPDVKPKVNSGLKLLRYAVLLVALYFTYKTGELILRGYDPFYIIFSGLGHGTLGTVSLVVFGATVVGAFIVPMFFCRYLCPLSATFDPFSRLGIIKIHRDEATCTGCGNCTAACPQGIAPDEMINVRHRDCTNCLECVDACPEDQVLQIQARL